MRDLAAIVGIALAFRLPALMADFWFDEIFSYERFARHARSITDIFFNSAFKHDNNHQLNTVALYLLGDQPHWLVYRLPALTAGLCAVVAVVAIGRRRSRLEGLFAGVLVASSYMIVVYSTEARGYAWLLAFTATAWLALDGFLTTRGRGALAAFWCSMAAGLAAHPTVMQFYLGALLWSGFRLRGAPRDMVRLHAGPVLWIAAWTLTVTRGAVVGGGPPWTWHGILDGSLAWTFGYPVQTVAPFAVGAGLLALVLWDARGLWMEGSDEGFFYVGTILGPIILMIALSPPYLFPRYFLVPLFFLLILTGRRIAAVTSGPWRGRWTVAAALLVAFVAGNVLHLAAMLRERRSNLTAAVQLLAERAGAGPVRVSSWSLDQWTELPLAFYSRRLGVSDRIEYVRREDLARRTRPAFPVDWVTQVSPPCEAPPAPERSLGPAGDKYSLRRSVPVCGPSGMSWYLYSRSSP